VVAEGIETNTTWRQVADLGCEMVQGYALARPMPGDDLMIWLRDAIGPASDSTDLSGVAPLVPIRRPSASSG
jgi:predicted signal transduction protein with EAL and GGDEF domain